MDVIVTTYLFSERCLFHLACPNLPENRVAVTSFQMLWQGKLIVDCERPLVAHSEKRCVPDKPHEFNLRSMHRCDAKAIRHRIAAGSSMGQLSYGACKSLQPHIFNSSTMCSMQATHHR